jgi:uncharacterized protein (DUF2236 family)
VNTTLAIVYGERAAAGKALRRIGRSHAPVRGEAEDGRSYRASDPRLMLWVQATLVLTSVRWYEAVMGPLAPAERDAYWEEGKLFAGELGVPKELFPKTYTDLERYEADMLRDEVVPDGTAKAVARDVLRPFRWLPKAVYWPTDVMSAALVPAELRDALALRFGARERALYRAMIVTVRVVRAIAPAWLTVVPHARRFESEFIRRDGA